MSCQYQDIFGKPRQGIHKYRIPILDIALADTLLTVALAFIVSKVFNIPFAVSFIIFILIGIVLHKIFCVNTKLNSKIFKSS
jgi:hypothetical protein